MITDDMTNALERMDDIACVWELISDLACSMGDDLHMVNRDNFTTATGFLAREYKQAREALSDATYKAIGKSL